MMLPYGDRAARRAFAASLSANTTEEISVEDVLEAIDDPAFADTAVQHHPASDDVAGPATWESADDAFYHPGGRVRSLGEVTIEAPRPESTLLFRLRARRKHFSGVVAAVLIVPLGILVGAALVWHEPSPATSSIASSIALPTAETTSAVTVPSVSMSFAPASASTSASDLAPTTGTIVAAPRQRLLLDGKRITEKSAIVSCGKHTVKIGWSKPRSVDVPCGGELRLR